jgi:hypothetical protein
MCTCTPFKILTYRRAGLSAEKTIETADRSTPGSHPAKLLRLAEQRLDPVPLRVPLAVPRPPARIPIRLQGMFELTSRSRHSSPEAVPLSPTTSSTAGTQSSADAAAGPRGPGDTRSRCPPAAEPLIECRGRTADFAASRASSARPRRGSPVGLQQLHELLQWSVGVTDRQHESRRGTGSVAHVQRSFPDRAWRCRILPRVTLR